MHHEFLTKVLDIGRQLAENRSLDPLLNYALTAALELFDAELGYIILLNYDGSLNFRTYQARHGPTEGHPDQDISQTILQQVMHSQQGLVVAAALDDKDFQEVPGASSPPIRSVLCVPLMAGGQTLGALYLENRAGSSVFTRVDLPAVNLFASQVAIAIENAQLNDELEERVAARTAELQNLVDELHAFSSTVAHDLKIPLSIISGFAGVLLNSSDTWSAKQQNYLQIIREKSATMSETIDALLLLARVREKEVDVSTLDMAVIVEHALATLAPLIEEAQAAVKLPEKWPLALGYAPWVREVWLNYLSNALKYGGVPPQLQLGADGPDEGGYVRFWVRDNGPAWQIEDPMQLFTPFIRLRETEAEGNGLGLSIVQRIVTRLGGQVGVEGGPDEGTVFSFTLPATPHNHSNAARG